MVKLKISQLRTIWTRLVAVRKKKKKIAIKMGKREKQSWKADNIYW